MRNRTRRRHLAPGFKVAKFDSARERTEVLSDALLEGTRVHWYEEAHAGWLRLPRTGQVVFVELSEVVGIYRRLARKPAQ